MAVDLVFDKDLIARYDKAGPRYTSYPTAVQFQEEFGNASYVENALCTNENMVPHQLSLYFHLPFCNTVCYYCACNKIITNNRKHAAPYLKLLHREIELQAALFDKDRQVNQLHWGGGTPTFISREQMSDLMAFTRSHFSLRDDNKGEYSVELDPRECDAETIALLRNLGFNRVSLGVQDFDPEVQKSVNRIQSEEETFAIIEAARHEGYKSISLDLIYGLPKQSADSFAQTLEKVISMQPDRLSIFNYAHMPDRFKVQKQINEAELPDPAVKLEIFQNNINTLIKAGYVYIGMDHFAKASDDLVKAQQNGTLHRNFQGYSTHAECDIVAMGMSAISRIGRSFSQNARDLIGYYAALDQGRLPVARGLQLSLDDEIRGTLIAELMCQNRIDIQGFGARYQIDFKDYFSEELKRLETLVKDGLVTWDHKGFSVTPRGRLLVRTVAMCFDAYLERQNGHNAPRYSRTI